MFDVIIPPNATLNITVTVDRKTADDIAQIKQTTATIHQVIMTYREAFDQLKTAQEQTNKGLGEVKSKMQELKDTIASLENLTPEQEALVKQAKEQAQQIDDIVPDPVTPPTPE